MMYGQETQQGCSPKCISSSVFYILIYNFLHTPHFLKRVVMDCLHIYTLTPQTILFSLLCPKLVKQDSNDHKRLAMTLFSF